MGRFSHLYLGRLFIDAPWGRSELELRGSSRSSSSSIRFLLSNNLRRQGVVRTDYKVVDRVDNTKHNDRGGSRYANDPHQKFSADGIVETAGTHDELMAQSGRYSELFELQVPVIDSFLFTCQCPETEETNVINCAKRKLGVPLLSTSDIGQ